MLYLLANQHTEPLIKRESNRLQSGRAYPLAHRRELAVGSTGVMSNLKSGALITVCLFIGKPSRWLCVASLSSARNTPLQYQSPHARGQAQLPRLSLRRHTLPCAFITCRPQGLLHTCMRQIMSSGRSLLFYTLLAIPLSIRRYAGHDVGGANSNNKCPSTQC